MTVVGKILVFLVLVFSLAVGGFAVMDFTARTHWADQYDKLSKKFQVVSASSTTYQNEAKTLAKGIDDYNAKMNAQGFKELAIKGPEDADQAAQRAAKLIRDLVAENDKLKTQYRGALADLTAEKTKSTKYSVVSESSLAENQRRQQDVERMRDVLKAETNKNTQLIRDMNELRDRAVGAEIEARTFKDMNKRLETELQDMARNMARMRATSGNTGVARNGLNPPPDNVEGLVRRADGNLVTITIGSDAGLLRGHTMEVFRLGQNPRYIGRIKIVDVTPTQAVGQATGRMATVMQVGDRVASRIMGGN